MMNNRSIAEIAAKPAYGGMQSSYMRSARRVFGLAGFGLGSDAG